MSSWGGRVKKVIMTLFTSAAVVVFGGGAIHEFQQERLWAAFVASLLATIFTLGTLYLVAELLEIKMFRESGDSSPPSHALRFLAPVSAVVLPAIALLFVGRGLWNLYLVVGKMMPVFYRSGKDLFAAGIELGVFALFLHTFLEDRHYPHQDPLRKVVVTIGVAAGVLCVAGLWFLGELDQM